MASDCSPNNMNVKKGMVKGNHSNVLAFRLERDMFKSKRIYDIGFCCKTWDYIMVENNTARQSSKGETTRFQRDHRCLHWNGTHIHLMVLSFTRLLESFWLKEQFKQFKTKLSVWKSQINARGPVMYDESFHHGEGVTAPASLTFWDLATIFTATKI